MNKAILLLLIAIFCCRTDGLDSNFLGCFSSIPQIRSVNLSQVHREEDCAIQCLKSYYRYFNFYDGSCICSNFLGEQITSNVTCDSHCYKQSSNACKDMLLMNVFATGNLVPGPPRDIRITKLTNESCRLIWKEPESYVNINGYVISAVILKTFSSYPPNVLEWQFGNNTFQAELPDLLPATKYNLSVYALSDYGYGVKQYQLIVTKLAEPEYLPPQPVILKNDGDKIEVKLSPVMNNNGPISFYRIVVVKSDDRQGFEANNVLPYDEAQKNGISYYVAAEITPQDIKKNFIVGDGKRYGRFYNARLDPDVNYQILVGLVSEFNGETKIAYSEASGYNNGISILNVFQEDTLDDASALVTGLSVAIVLLTTILIAGIIGFIILKKKVDDRRQRLSDNQELTLQGPMIEVENNGYINDEEHIPAISHYRNLIQKVRTIPQGQLKVEPANLLGVGKFGKVNTGTLHENENMTTVTCYSIHDKRMNQETKRAMLQELDVLIKAGQQDNILSLIGTSETREMVIVAMEYNSVNLKDFLLGSRDNVSNKFTTMTEQQALDISMGICQGMAHLHSLSIIHKQLCARSVQLSNKLVPKIGSFGLAQYFSHNKIPDYTRWSSLEVLKGNPSNSKCDVWSFACVLWEVIALGGTPYGSIPNNNEILTHLSKGVRLPQLRYVSDELYQLMLDCWQLIPDERPEFDIILQSLASIKETALCTAMSFKLYSSFQYEQFSPDVEFSARPIF
ncbi:putative inactive tyrosine-protein kinase Wsck [Euwallacea fornicatus]|uniref:putative inactive tyrosine-protein kinase Wsck n=1 Tax=Euwallacea fornicatus TaxID=995702 RepID=UPI00338F4F4B